MPQNTTATHSGVKKKDLCCYYIILTVQKVFEKGKTDNKLRQKSSSAAFHLLILVLGYTTLESSSCDTDIFLTQGNLASIFQ